MSDGCPGKQLCRKGSGGPGGQVEDEPAMCPCGRMAQSVLGCFREIRTTSSFPVLPPLSYSMSKEATEAWIPMDLGCTGPSSCSLPHTTAPLCCQGPEPPVCQGVTHSSVPSCLPAAPKKEDLDLSLPQLKDLSGALSSAQLLFFTS